MAAEKIGILRKKVIYCSVNDLNFIPVLRCFVSRIIGFAEVVVIHPRVGTQPGYYADKEAKLLRFKSLADFYAQSVPQKLWKHLACFWYLTKCLFSVKVCVYITPDIVILKYVRILKKIFFFKKIYLGYHQFEMVEEGISLSKTDRHLLNTPDFYIFPEINRRDHFIAHYLSREKKNFIIPNTNDLELDAAHIVPKSKYVIAHIGSLGLDSDILLFLGMFQKLDANKFELWFVGIKSIELQRTLDKTPLKNVRIFDHVPHSELFTFYQQVDFGVILYNNGTLNQRFCAPNKLFEYWSFGIPVLANPLDGLLPFFINEDLGCLTGFHAMEQTKSYIEHYTENIVQRRKHVQQIFTQQHRFEHYSGAFEDYLKKHL